MPTELIYREHCGAECPTCVKTRRMVSAVVAGTLDHLIAWTEAGDLDRAERAAIRLLKVVDKTPVSTLELVGAENVSQLTMNVEAALSRIQSGDAATAVSEFRLGMTNWFETYPPYRI